MSRWTARVWFCLLPTWRCSMSLWGGVLLWRMSPQVRKNTQRACLFHKIFLSTLTIWTMPPQVRKIPPWKFLFHKVHPRSYNVDNATPSKENPWTLFEGLLNALQTNLPFRSLDCTRHFWTSYAQHDDGVWWRKLGWLPHRGLHVPQLWQYHRCSARNQNIYS